jgi:hypothetical protein
MERVKNLLQLGAAVFIADVLLLRALLHLSLGKSAWISAIASVIMVGAFDRLLAQRSRNRKAVLHTESHPDLGMIRVLRNRWEATVSDAAFDGEIEVYGDSRTVSKEQAALFREIRERYHSLSPAALSSLEQDLRSARPLLSATDLELESIAIDDEGRRFTFTFAAPSRSEQLPDGFYVDFADFKVEEAGWVH